MEKKIKSRIDLASHKRKDSIKLRKISSDFEEKKLLSMTLIQKQQEQNFNLIEKIDTETRSQAQLINSIRKKFWESFEERIFTHTKFPKYLMFGLILILQTELIFSGDFSKIYKSNYPETKDRDLGILAESSFTNLILKSLNPVDLARKIKPELLIALLSLVLLMKISIVLIFIWKKPVEFFFTKFVSSDGDITFKENFLTFIRIYMNYFDLIFLLTNHIAINSLLCEKIEISYTQEFEEGAQGSSIKADYINMIQSGNQILRISKYSSFLNNDVYCRLNGGFGIASSTIGLMLLIANFLVKYFLNKIWTLGPSIEFQRSKHGNFDWVLDASISLGVFLRGICVENFQKDLNTVRTIFIIYFVILSLCLFITWTNLNFYDKKFSALKKFQLLYMILITGLQIAAMNNYWDFFSFDKEISFIILVLLISVFCLKLAIEKGGTCEKLISKILNNNLGQKMNESEILEYYYLTIKFLNLIVRSNRKNIKMTRDDLKISFLINTFFQWHKSNCLSLKCVCKKSDLITHVKETPIYIPFSTKIFNKNITPLKSLLFCEEIFKNYFKTKGSDPSPEILAAYTEYLMEYQGKPLKAKIMLEKMKYFYFKEKTNLTIEIIKDKLDHIAGLNLFNGSLALAKYHKIIHNEITKKSEVVDSQDHVLFLNAMERLKVLTQKCGDIKMRFLDDLRENQDMKTAYLNIKDFTMMKKKVGKLSEKLVHMSKGHYVPLLHIMWKYTRDVCQCFICSTGYLNLYKKSLKSKLQNLNLIFYKDETMEKVKEDDFCTVYVSGEEENFHQVVYCTSNMFELTGWKNREIIGGDLNILIPEPIRSFHKSLLQPKFFTGKFLTCNRYRSMACLNRDGHLKELKLALRLNESISTGLQYIGIMQFSKELKAGIVDRHCILLTDQRGRITAGTRSALDIFEIGNLIFSYNSELKSAYENKNFNGKFYQLNQDTKMQKAWKDYLKWSEHRIRKINIKGILEISVEAKLQYRIVHQKKRILKFFIIRNIRNQQIFQDFSVNWTDERAFEEKEKREERLNIESVVFNNKEIQEKLKFQKIDKDVLFQENGEGILVHRHQQRYIRSLIESKEGQLIVNRKEELLIESIKELDEEQTEKRIQLEKASKNKNDDDAHRKGKFFNQKNIQSRKKSQDYGVHGNFDTFSLRVNKEPSQKKEKLDLEDFEITKNNLRFKLSKLIHHHPKFSITGKFFPTASTEKKSLQLVDSNLNSIHSKSFIKAENTKFKTQTVHITTNTKFHWSVKISLYSLTFLFFLNSFAIFIRGYFQKMTTSEAPIALTAIDVVNWITWSQLYGIISLERNRAVREGWISKNDVKKYLKGENYWERTYVLQTPSKVWTFSEESQRKADIMLKNIEFEGLFPELDKWILDYIEIDIFELEDEFENDQGNDIVGEKNKGIIHSKFGIRWEKKRFSRHEAIEMSAIAGKAYENRNYENDSLKEIPSLGEERDRNKDPFEDYFRRLLTGQSLKSATERIWNFEEYLKAVCSQNEGIIFWTFIGSFVGSCVIVLSIGGFLYGMKQYMVNLYVVILKNKESDLIKNIETYEKKLENFKYILKDEQTETYQKMKLRKFQTTTNSEFFSKNTTVNNPLNPKKKLKKNDNVSPISNRVRFHQNKSKKNLLRSKKRHRRKNFTKIKEKSFSFEMSNLYSQLVLLLFIFLILQGTLYLIFLPKAKRVTNLSKIYILSLEAWNEYYILHTAVIETLLYNNTFSMWDGRKNTYEFYYDFRSFMKSNIIENITESLNYDLGSFTEKYRNVMTNGNSCQTVFHEKETDKEEFPFCHEWYDGLLNSNYFNSHTGILTSLDRLMQEWTQKRHSWEEVNKILKDPTFLAIVAKMRRIWMVPYYWGSIETSKLVNDQLKEDEKLETILMYFLIIFIVGVYFVIYRTFVLRFQSILLFWISVLGILPIDLLKGNLIGLRYLEKMALGKEKIF